MQDDSVLNQDSERSEKNKKQAYCHFRNYDVEEKVTVELCCTEPTANVL